MLCFKLLDQWTGIFEFMSLQRRLEAASRLWSHRALFTLSLGPFSWFSFLFYCCLRWNFKVLPKLVLGSLSSAISLPGSVFWVPGTVLAREEFFNLSDKKLNPDALAVSEEGYLCLACPTIWLCFPPALNEVLCGGRQEIVTDYQFVSVALPLTFSLKPV